MSYPRTHTHSAEGQMPACAHIPCESFLAYRAGDLTPKEEDAIAEHLGECENCRDLLSFYYSFPDDHDKPGVTQIDLHRSWREMQKMIRLVKHEEGLESKDPPRRRPKKAAYLGIAALLAVTIPSILLWRAYQIIDILSKPRADTKVVDIKRSHNRSATPGETITVEADKQSLFLIVPVDDARGNCEARILNDKGREVWIDRTVDIDRHVIYIGISRYSLASGQYFIEVSGPGEDGSQRPPQLYPITIEFK